MGEMTEKVCPNCGEKLPNDSSFCIKCGTKIEIEAPKIENKPNFVKQNKKKVTVGVIGIVSVLVILFAVKSAII